MKKCKSCKHWGLNRNAAFNGPENVSYKDADFFSESHPSSGVGPFTWWSTCKCDRISTFLCAWETSLPEFIKVTLRKEFKTPCDFGCSFWELYIDWCKLW